MLQAYSLQARRAMLGENVDPNAYKHQSHSYDQRRKVSQQRRGWHRGPKKLDYSKKAALERAPKNEASITYSLIDEQEDSLFIYPYTIGNKDTPLTTLIDTCAIGGNFIHFSAACILYNANNLLLYTLYKLINVKGFNSYLVPSIIYKLSISLKIRRHS